MADSPLREVAAGVFTATSERDLTNSVLVLVGPSDALLIDPTWTAPELVALADGVQDAGLTVVAGVATHAHFDHLLWHPRFGDVPRWATARTVDTVRQGRSALLAALGPGYPAEVVALFGAVTALPDAGHSPAAPLVVPVTGRRVELIGHDAHEPGSLAVWLPDAAVLIAGDMLSDVEIPLLGPSPASGTSSIDAYRDGLDRLAPSAERARLVIPGHGNAGSDAIARLAADRRYLHALAVGRASDDPRLGDPAMAAAHIENLERTTAD